MTFGASATDPLWQLSQPLGLKPSACLWQFEQSPGLPPVALGWFAPADVSVLSRNESIPGRRRVALLADARVRRARRRRRRPARVLPDRRVREVHVTFSASIRAARRAASRFSAAVSYRSRCRSSRCSRGHRAGRGSSRTAASTATSACAFDMFALSWSWIVEMSTPVTGPLLPAVWQAAVAFEQVKRGAQPVGVARRPRQVGRRVVRHRDAVAGRARQRDSAPPCPTAVHSRRRPPPT